MGPIILPLPNDEFDDAVVVASVWQNDDDGTALVMLLRKEPPYYAVCDVEWRDGAWQIINEEPHVNINPATEAYADHGGDY